MADEFPVGCGSWWDASRNGAVSRPGASFVWQDDDVRAAGVCGGGSLSDMQMMGLSMNWSQPRLIDEKCESSFGSLIQEHMNFVQESDPAESCQAQSSSTDECISPFNRIDYSLFLSENQARSDSYAYHQRGHDNPVSSWNKLFPSRTQSPVASNTPFWNESPPRLMQEGIQPQTASFLDQKAKKKVSEATTKKNLLETSNKRSRGGSSTPSPLPSLKVRKENVRDRVTALQQLVSPFGKTDMASVFHEASECIKSLQEQICMLSAPYIRTGVSRRYMPTISSFGKSGGAQQSLTSRGLCLMPISSAFPVTNEAHADFWTPTFGGTFRR